MGDFAHVRVDLTYFFFRAFSKKGIFVSNLNTRYPTVYPSKNSTPAVASDNLNHFELQKVSLQVEPGQTLSIIGPVGSGKSTLLLTLLSEIRVQAADQFEVNGSLAYVSQEVY